MHILLPSSFSLSVRVRVRAWASPRIFYLAPCRPVPCFAASNSFYVVVFVTPFSVAYVYLTSTIRTPPVKPIYSFSKSQCKTDPSLNSELQIYFPTSEEWPIVAVFNMYLDSTLVQWEIPWVNEDLLTREWSDPTCRNLPWFFFFFFNARVHTTKSTVKILAANTHCKYFLKTAEHCQYCNLPDPWRNVHP
jgi:hypothetical protein